VPRPPSRSSRRSRWPSEKRNGKAARRQHDCRADDHDDGQTTRTDRHSHSRPAAGGTLTGFETTRRTAVSDSSLGAPRAQRIIREKIQI